MSKGKLYLFLSAFLYGVAPVFAAFAYRGGMNGITLTFLRSAAALPILFLFIGISGRSYKIQKRHIKSIIILGIFGGALPILLLYMSYMYISIGLATTLHFIYPIIIVIISAVLYHERISRVTLSSVVFVTIGIFMFSNINTASDKRGIILAVISGILYSFYVIYIDRSGLDRLDHSVLTFYIAIIMSIITAIFGLFTDSLSFSVAPQAWYWGLLISLTVTFGAMPLFQLGVRYEGSSTAGIISTIEPITSILMDLIVLGETVDTGQMLGGAMILFGVLLSQKRNITAKKTA